MSDDERRANLHEQVRAMRRELNLHVAEEMPILRSMLQELGTSEQVRQRRVFIELLIDRERDRKKLRTAIIEKSLLFAILALLVFIGTAIWHELGTAIKLMVRRN